MTKDEALDLALDALKNVAVTGPDDDGLVWINLPGNGTTGKAILRVGKAGLIAAQCAKLYEEQRTKAITALTAIKQARSAPVQEPVAWRYDLAKYRENDLRGRQWAHSVFSPTKPYIDEMVRNLTPLYTTPPAQPAPALQEPVAHCEAGPNSCPQCHKESRPTYGSEEVRKLREVIESQAKIIESNKPPPWFNAVENILKEYGLQAIDFVADFKAAIVDAEQHAAQPAVPDFKAFKEWAADEGYDVAYTHDGIKWVCLNPMTADLWRAWQAANGITKGQQ